MNELNALETLRYHFVQIIQKIKIFFLLKEIGNN